MAGLALPANRSRSWKSLVATMMTLVSLMEETARIQKEIAELLRELARGGNDAAIQRLNRAGHPISRPSSVQNSLSSPLGRAGDAASAPTVRTPKRAALRQS